MSTPSPSPQSSTSREAGSPPQRPAQTTYGAARLFHGNQYRAERRPPGVSDKPHRLALPEEAHVRLADMTVEKRGEKMLRGLREPQTRGRDHAVDRITARLPQRVGRKLRQHLLRTGETQSSFIRRAIESLLGAEGG